MRPPSRMSASKMCIRDSHDGGFSTFRADITALLKEQNELTVIADNSKNDFVYPQKADFTFYGGIYRTVSLLVVSKDHIALDYLGGPGVQITPTVQGANADIRVETRVSGCLLYTSRLGRACAASTKSEKVPLYSRALVSSAQL